MIQVMRFLQTPYGILVTLLVGIIGVVLTELPDMFPNSHWVSLPPHLAALDTGFSDLAQLDEKDSEGVQIGALRDGEEGFDELYDLLRIFNPNIPPLTEVSSEQVGGIYTSETARIKNPLGNVPLVRPVFIHLKELGSNPVPICDMRDLAFLIHDRKVSFWSRTGSILTVVALLSSAVSSLADANRNPRSLENKLSEPQLPPSESQLTVSETGSGSRDSAPIAWGLLFAALLCLVAIVLDQSKRQRQKDH